MTRRLGPPVLWLLVGLLGGFGAFGVQAQGSVLVLGSAPPPDAAAWMGARADRWDLADLVRSYGGVFLPGGDQNRYVMQWRGTAAVQDVFASGGVVAGTSAGAMVLGSVAYDARMGSVSARGALEAPASADVALSASFLSLVPRAVIDTHSRSEAAWRACSRSRRARSPTPSAWTTAPDSPSTPPPRARRPDPSRF